MSTKARGATYVNKKPTVLR